MAYLEKFDGTGDLKVHFRMYVGVLRPIRIHEELLGQLFQRTLIGATLHCFLDLAPSKVKMWVLEKERLLGFLY